MERYAPTATQIGFYILLQVYSTGLLDPRGKWLLATGDVATAFLQGSHGEERDEPLYMAPPRDPIATAAGAFKEARLWKVVGNVYGLANAPHNFYLVVRDKMLSLEFVPHSLDVCFYMFFEQIEPATEEQFKNDIWIGMVGQTWRLIAAVLFHVDDMLGAFSPVYDWKILKEAFVWGGEWNWAPAPLNWAGYDLRFDQKERVTVHQTTFTESTTVRKVPNQTRRQPELQKGSEMTEYKSCGGSVNWLATHTRYDLAAPSSILQKGSPTLTDLRQLYKVLEYARETSTAGITMNPVPFNKAMTVDFSDSSWANLEDLKTQMGFLVILTTFAALTTGAYGSILEAKSFRSKRMLRSTLAAEAAAKDAGVDHGTFIGAFLSELITGVKAKEQPCVFQHCSVTDCKSLYDAVRQATPSLSEKRTIIDLTATRESLAKDHLLWVPTYAMLADALTKVDFNLMRTMTKIMSHTWVSLRGAEG